ncbi:hypothetical protein CAPTEDRAFT_227122 [Capitella teleta]|uniref:SUEL-type lectin domain-containing protein n=1 Tax=Capitella teleta TaxID=283909 RepID=R7V8K3_CAPTE|nr:hypothetical protein CAPTEDRAFT_227122 [Capitella teleta]|eukprot:ELU12090.1 hypothetical protein CAPTEDRAFT_227122 [Capitella teleta]
MREIDDILQVLWRCFGLALLLTIEKSQGYYQWREEKVTVCEHNAFTIECPAQQSIVIKKAEYGHIGISKCVEVDTGHFGCKIDVSSLLDENCQSSKCIIDANEEEIRKLNPCRRGLDVFIKLSYMCVDAKPLLPCQPQMVTSKPSYISSRQTSVGSCNSQAHIGGTQFFFKTTPGQQLQFSMLRLSTSPSLSGRHNHTATQVGYIVDEGQDEVYPIELNHRRQTMHPLLKSTSNEVTVSLLATEHQHFLILVQGQYSVFIYNDHFMKGILAFGCQDLKPPKGDTMLIERHGDTTVVSCINSKKMWNLKCIGVHWSGVIGNCSDARQPVVRAVVNVAAANLALPKDIILMTIVGLTVVLALVIVTVGYVCYKRSMESIGMEPLLDVAEYNKAPALPTKRGSTLLRGTLHRQSMAAEAPVPPPLRTNPQDLNNATIRLNHAQTVNLL